MLKASRRAYNSVVKPVETSNLEASKKLAIHASPDVLVVEQEAHPVVLNLLGETNQPIVPKHQQLVPRQERDLTILAHWNESRAWFPRTTSPTW